MGKREKLLRRKMARRRKRKREQAKIRKTRTKRRSEVVKERSFFWRTWAIVDIGKMFSKTGWTFFLSSPTFRKLCKIGDKKGEKPG